MMSVSCRHRIVAVQLVLLLVGAVSLANAGKIYWSERTFTTSLMQRANLDGSNVQDVVDRSVDGIAIDPVARQLYWGEWSPPALWRANLDGSNAMLLHDLIGQLLPGPIAVDPASGWIFTNKGIGDGCDGIVRFPLDGSGAGEPVVFGICAGGLVVDSDAGKLYWTEVGRIRRANQDGSDLETLFETEYVMLEGLALDVARGKVYWAQADLSLEKILRANLDGSNTEVLVARETDAYGIALDLQADKLYYTLGQMPGEIYRAELDGSNAEKILTVNPSGQIALDPVGGDDVPAASPRGVVLLALAILMVSSLLLGRRRGTGRS